MLPGIGLEKESSTINRISIINISSKIALL